MVDVKSSFFENDIHSTDVNIEDYYFTNSVFDSTVFLAGHSFFLLHRTDFDNSQVVEETNILIS